MRSLFKFLTKKEIVSKDLARNLPKIKTNNKLTQRYLSEEKVMRMINLTQNLRDRTVLKLLYGTGVRLTELISLTWEALEERENKTGQITVVGKGGFQHTIHFSCGIYEDVIQLKYSHSKRHDSVLLSNRGVRISPRMVQVIVDKARLRPSIVRRVSPHWFRHAHASHALDRGAPLYLVQATLGHRHPSFDVLDPKNGAISSLIWEKTEALPVFGKMGS